ncbi:dual specificity protein phosphatase [Mycoplasmatota bacterium WC30]
MIEIYKNLYIGNQIDYESLVDKDSYFIVQACKDPYHREALGYTGRGALKTHPEYYFAYRQNKLICNLVDVANPDYIPDTIINEALNFIYKHISKGERVFVHCNQGMSRSAVIGLMYLKEIGAVPRDFLNAENKYREIYPLYNPANGMRMYAYNNWDKHLL